MSPKPGRVADAPKASKNVKDVLVVCEDPGIVSEVQQTIREHGGVAVGCLGPAHSECLLESSPVCPLAGNAAIALVVSPPSGEFRRVWKTITAGDYAERIAAAHPLTFVILCDPPEGAAGPTGAVTVARDRRRVLALVAWMTGVANLSNEDAPTAAMTVPG